METAFLYSDDFGRFDYGSNHPLKAIRLKLTYELIKACGLLAPHDPRVIEPPLATVDDLLMFHTAHYIEILKTASRGKPLPDAAASGLGPGDNPIFPGMYDGSRLAAGASLKAADLVDSGDASIAFAISGGLHHAMADRASGFCYVNDPVLAIASLVKRGRRVAYIDIDAHHGDGVQAAFYDTEKVLTISLHETGELLFPGTGFEHETGAGAGAGFSINIPLPAETDDELFVYAFSEVVPRSVEAFNPDIVVSQLGVDTFRADPLAHLNLTTHGFCELVGMIKSLAPKWVALGGGGYDIANVARAWTLAWSIMNDVGVPDEIPEPFLRQYTSAGFISGTLQDEHFAITGIRKEQMKKEVDRVLAYLKSHVRLLF
jgi:acetoin utilization protein AcuC